jgi:hypothetical protein
MKSNMCWINMHESKPLLSFSLWRAGERIYDICANDIILANNRIHIFFYSLVIDLPLYQLHVNSEVPLTLTFLQSDNRPIIGTCVFKWINLMTKHLFSFLKFLRYLWFPPIGIFHVQLSQFVHYLCCYFATSPHYTLPKMEAAYSVLYHNYVL